MFIIRNIPEQKYFADIKHVTVTAHLRHKWVLLVLCQSDHYICSELRKVRKSAVSSKFCLLVLARDFSSPVGNKFVFSLLFNIIFEPTPFFYRLCFTK